MSSQSLDLQALQRAANEARGLSMDAVAACSSGHLGLPLGCAELGAVLYGHALQVNPKDPKWLNRDRFILSAGHGSMFLYSWLHLSGYAVSREDVKSFRKLHSITPGHPEYHETPGVETTTGPLGQGVGNGVGYAVSQKALQALVGDKDLLDYHVVVLAGDGCLQEGVAAEASSFAGRFGLDNLILFYDSNDVTLDAMADKTQREDTALRYESYGWEVTTLTNGHDMTAIADAYAKAKASKNGKPKLIILKTEIGRGIPQVAGSPKAHGEGGAKFVDEAHKALGLPAEHFSVSAETEAFFKKLTEQREAAYAAWQTKFAAWESANPEKAKLLKSGLAHKHADVKKLLAEIPEFDPTKAIATRVAGEKALNAVAAHAPLVLSGSADLHGSTKNYIANGGDFDIDTPAGRNFHFGIREHGMGAILNGMAYDAVFKVSGATFLTFSDYMRPAVRVAALSNLPIFYIWTHDSVGVGEDGPTHQPIEHVMSLRAIPNLDVIRPGDAEETAGAYAAAIERADGPTALILSRQNLPLLTDACVAERREGVLKGGYILRKEKGALKQIIIATGSEVQHAVKAADELGDGVRVVSLPCWERFERESAEYRESVLPAAVTNRVSIEAGVTLGWQKWTGFQGKNIGIDRFGMSAPGDTVMEQLGITAANLVKVAKSV